MIMTVTIYKDFNEILIEKNIRMKVNAHGIYRA